MKPLNQADHNGRLGGGFRLILGSPSEECIVLFAPTFVGQSLERLVDPRHVFMSVWRVAHVRVVLLGESSIRTTNRLGIGNWPHT